MELVSRDCEICGSSRSRDVYQESYAPIVGLEDADFTLHIAICEDCGFVYSNPAPSAETLARYYRTFSNYLNPQRQGAASLAMLRKWARTCDLVERALPAGVKGRVLEVGSATGAGLAVFKARGWQVQGLDPSPAASAVAKALYDIDVATGTLEQHDLRQHAPFDLIVLSHVLEHLLQPGTAIDRLASLCRPGGLLYLEVPNLLRPFVATNHFLIEHVNYFTPVTLGSLANTHGFTTASVDLFDNSADIQPFYPVIAGVYAWSPAAARPAIAGDFDRALAAVRGYQDTTREEIARLERRLAGVVEAVAAGRLAIWGAGIHTSQLLAATQFPRHVVSRIFDNDPTKHGRRLAGIEIAPFRGPEDTKAVADAILISSRASEREIYEHIRYLEPLGINVFRLYD